MIKHMLCFASLVIYSATGVCQNKLVTPNIQHKVKNYEYYYDNSGNLIQIDQNHHHQANYAYNSLNQLSIVLNFTNKSRYQYLYYADAKRAEKINIKLDQCIYFYYGLHGKLITEAFTINGKPQAKRSFFAGGHFVKNINNTTENITQTFMVRHNIPFNVSFPANDINRASYHINDYGNIQNSNATVPKTNSLMWKNNDINFNDVPYRFADGYNDEESGFYYYFGRYYYPLLAHFISQDTKNLLNRYSYANSNPTMNYDPSGHTSISNFLTTVKKVTWGNNTPQHIGFVLGILGNLSSGVIIGSIAMLTPLIIDHGLTEIEHDALATAVNAAILSSIRFAPIGMIAQYQKYHIRKYDRALTQFLIDIQNENQLQYQGEINVNDRWVYALFSYQEHTSVYQNMTVSDIYHTFKQRVIDSFRLPEHYVYILSVRPEDTASGYRWSFNIAFPTQHVAPSITYPPPHLEEALTIGSTLENGTNELSEQVTVDSVNINTNLTNKATTLMREL